MPDKIVVLHDNRVYETLRKQAKINRRFAMFSLAMTACLVILAKTCNEQDKKLQELSANKEEDRGVRIDI